MKRKWVVSEQYRQVVDAVRDARLQQGVTQRELARRLNKPPSFVNKIELYERRMDVLEFIAICRALGLRSQDQIKRIDENIINLITL